MSIDLNSICLEACSSAREAGAFIREQRKVFEGNRVEYKGFNDLVSYVDKHSEMMLVESLKKILPGAGFITEENTASEKSDHYTWIIDPLDGTTNFVHGVPCFCVSIGLLHQQQIVLGVIYEINLDECFYAWKDGGAWLNEQRISVSSETQLSRSLLATGFPYTNFSRMKEYMDVFDYCMRNTHGIRRLGSAAVDMAYVACGRFEGFYEYGLNSWDVAGGCCIIAEAGGRISDFSGGNNFLFGKEIIACNDACFVDFLEIVKSRFS
jgi:myo-inositol-1(or 4)-monophosphatase